VHWILGAPLVQLAPGFPGQGQSRGRPDADFDRSD